MLTDILVCNLLKQNLTLIGTVMANRREVHRNSKQQKEKRLKALRHCMTILSKFYYCHMSTNATEMCLRCPLHMKCAYDVLFTMSGSGKCDRKTDFFKQLSFLLAQPYVSNQKLRGETKVPAEKIRFIDAASNTINRTVQGIKRERCYIYGKHTRFACLVCRRRVCPQHRKIQKNTYCLEC